MWVYLGLVFEVWSWDGQRTDDRPTSHIWMLTWASNNSLPMLKVLVQNALHRLRVSGPSIPSPLPLITSVQAYFERIRGAFCDDALYKLTFTFTTWQLLRHLLPSRLTSWLQFSWFNWLFAACEDIRSLTALFSDLLNDNSLMCEYCTCSLYILRKKIHLLPFNEIILREK